MWKKFISLLLTIVFVTLAAGCADPEASIPDNANNAPVDEDTVDSSTGKEVYSSRHELYMTFTEFLAESDCAAIGTFVSYGIDEDGYSDYVFKISEVLRGEILEKEIHVCSAIGHSNVQREVQGEYVTEYDFGGDIYTPGEEYVLILSKNDSLFNERPRYGIHAGVFIPVKDTGASTMYGMPLTEVAGKNIASIKQMIRNSAMMRAQKKESNYTKETDLPAVVAESDFILEVKVTDLMVEGIYNNSNTYYCDVQKVLKGESITKSEERGDIMVTLMKDSVEVGGSYVVLVNQIGEDSLIYAQSSLSSVISVGDTETIQEIQKLIENV